MQGHSSVCHRHLDRLIVLQGKDRDKVHQRLTELADAWGIEIH
jgi:hypothetical protein